MYLNGQGYQAPHTRMPNNIVKDFIQMHMEYPASAIANNEEGTVLISFTISKEGKISNIKIEKSVSNSVDSAAIHLFKRILLGTR